MLTVAPVTRRSGSDRGRGLSNSAWSPTVGANNVDTQQCAPPPPFVRLLVLNINIGDKWQTVH